MNISISTDDLRPLLSVIVQDALEQLEAGKAGMGDQLAFSESHAARLLGLNSHQLRDERQRGRISSTKVVGGQIRYCRDDLLQYLNRHRSAASK